MMTNRHFLTVRDYESPAVERISIEAEQGFAASYGSEGAPGSGFGNGDVYDF